MPEMTMTFEWDGETVHKETSGFEGKECISKTKKFEDSLGDTGHRKLKSEFYEEQSNQNEEDQDRLHF